MSRKNKSYNGHRNWNSWNVSLWMLNDEETYKRITSYLRRYTKDQVADFLADEFESFGPWKTPDGAKYHKTSIRDALIGL